MTDSTAKAALHEAAHSVVALLENIPLSAVTLSPAEVWAAPPKGWVNRAEAPARRYLPGDANDPEQRAWIAPRTRVALAGVVVDAHVFAEVRDECGDFEHAVQLVGELDLAGDSAQLYLERLQCQTSWMLAEHWAAVLAIANLLIKRNTLSGGEVRSILIAHRSG